MIDGGEVIRKLALNVARYSGLAPLGRPLVGGIGAILMLHRVTAVPEKPLGVNRHLNIAPDFVGHGDNAHKTPVGKLSFFDLQQTLVIETQIVPYLTDRATLLRHAH